MSRSDNTTAVILAFAVALVTAFSYMELVTKYPHAAGAALYTHKAFGIHFVTLLVAFAVLSSGITSAATASNVFASNLVAGFGWDLPGTGVMWIALGFLALVAAINLRGVGGERLVQRPVDHDHFKAPKYLPWLGFVTCAFLVGPWARLEDPIQCQIALALISIGVILWALTWLWNRSIKGSSTKFRTPEELT